jgi:hypothetical protein
MFISEPMSNTKAHPTPESIHLRSSTEAAAKATPESHQRSALEDGVKVQMKSQIQGTKKKLFDI